MKYHSLYLSIRPPFSIDEQLIIYWAGTIRPIAVTGARDEKTSKKSCRANKIKQQ